MLVRLRKKGVVQMPIRLRDPPETLGWGEWARGSRNLFGVFPGLSKADSAPAPSRYYGLGRAGKGGPGTFSAFRSVLVCIPLRSHVNLGSKQRAVETGEQPSHCSLPLHPLRWLTLLASRCACRFGRATNHSTCGAGTRCEPPSWV